MGFIKNLNVMYRVYEDYLISIYPVFEANGSSYSAGIGDIWKINEKGEAVQLTGLEREFWKDGCKSSDVNPDNGGYELNIDIIRKIKKYLKNHQDEIEDMKSRISKERKEESKKAMAELEKRIAEKKERKSREETRKNNTFLKRLHKFFYSNK